MYPIFYNHVTLSSYANNKRKEACITHKSIPWKLKRLPRWSLDSKICHKAWSLKQYNAKRIRSPKPKVLGKPTKRSRTSCNHHISNYFPNHVIENDTKIPRYYATRLPFISLFVTFYFLLTNDRVSGLNY